MCGGGEAVINAFYKVLIALSLFIIIVTLNFMSRDIDKIATRLNTIEGK